MKKQLTGRFTFKRKWSGMVLFVEVEAYDPGDQLHTYTHWRKATEIDIENLKLVSIS